MRKVGIIVAGGKSTRMGKDKASLIYQGQSMLDHAISLLEQMAVEETVVLGKPEHDLGMPDPIPNGGPAANLRAWINAQKLPLKLIVVPVDMPLLTTDQLSDLEAMEVGAYFDDLYLPLIATISSPVDQETIRMKELLSALRLSPKHVPEQWAKALTNFNSPADFEQ